MRDKIQGILLEIRPECKFDESSNFIRDEMLDSFDVLTLVDALDAAFAISIDGTDIVPENFESIDSIESLLRRNGAKE